MQLDTDNTPLEDSEALQKKKQNTNTLVLITGNLIFLAFLLAGIEVFARYFLPEPPVYGRKWSQPGQYPRYDPYLAMTNEGPLDAKGEWFDGLHNEFINYHVKSNRLGFRVDREMDTTTRYKKAENERVVLIFGGSTVYGFGNTSNDTTIAGWLEKKLNEGDGKVKYTVFNLGNGWWISYQQLIALNLYGLVLDPDWIIVMDGRNDIWTIPGSWGEDVGMPFITRPWRELVDGMNYHQPKYTMFRGYVENELLKLSSAYRYFSGKRVIPNKQPYWFHKTGKKNWDDVDKTIDFYLRTQESILRQCPTCKYILSTQPIYRHGRSAMSNNERVEIRKKLSEINIDGGFLHSEHFEDVVQYSYGRIHDEMPAICRKHGPSCFYKAMDHVMPLDPDMRNKYFVDDVHLKDTGNEILASYYASEIIKRDNIKK